jgi:hypothetical protein
VAGAVLAGNAAPGWLRLAVAALLADAWRQGRDWLAYPGATGQRLIWDADGSWWLQDAGRGLRQVRLAALPHRLGPWTWLPFRGRAGADLTVIDARYAEPVGLRRLQAALRMEIRSLKQEVRDA